MTGLYFLNGLDMYTTYGFCPSVRCSDDFLKMRKRKAVYVNNWEEEDGMEYDLSSPPKYEDREIKLIGFIKASDTSDLWNKYNALKNVFNTTPIINIECKEYNANELVKCFYKSTNVFEIYKDKVGENVAYCNIEITLQEVQSYIPPVVSIPVPTLTANDTANTLSASVSGGYTIQYRENGGAWSTYSSTINVGDVDRAANYYTFRATDGTNYSSIIGSPAFTQAVVSIPTPTLTANDTANTLSASVSGGYTIQYRENGGAWNTYSSTINVGDVDRAAGYYEFRATDGTNYSSIVGSPAFTQAVVVDCDPHWDNVISLLRGNGTDGSTTIVDEKGATWVKTGNVAVSTAQSKFGGSSLYFDGTGYLKNTFAEAITTPEYTVEGWFYFNSYTPQYLFGENLNYLSFATHTNADGSLRLLSSSNVSSDPVIVLNTFMHIAVVKTATHLKQYVNGVEVLSMENNNISGINSIFISAVSWDVVNSHFNGYIDDFRITKGVARYTANFTPPDKQFPNVGCSGG